MHVLSLLAMVEGYVNGHQTFCAVSGGWACALCGAVSCCCFLAAGLVEQVQRGGCLTASCIDRKCRARCALLHGVLWGAVTWITRAHALGLHGPRTLTHKPCCTLLPSSPVAMLPPAKPV